MSTSWERTYSAEVTRSAEEDVYGCGTINDVDAERTGCIALDIVIGA